MARHIRFLIYFCVLTNEFKKKRKKLVKRNLREVDRPPGPKRDLFDTPKTASQYLAGLIPGKNLKVWEPCAGNRKLAEEIELLGHTVFCSDLHPTDLEMVLFNSIKLSQKTKQVKHDFLDDEIPAEAEDADIIITNPPYGLNNKIFAKLYSIGKPFLILGPLTLLETKKRGDMFREHGLSLHIIPHRVKFTALDANFNVSWFSYECGHPQMTFLRME